MIPLAHGDSYRVLPNGASRVVISFSGLHNTDGKPRFEFGSTLQALDTNVIFVCDHTQSWYSHGVPGLGGDASTVARSLRELTQFYFPGQPVVTLGNSMGGYAALLFSCLCEFQKSISFVPQTLIPDPRYSSYFNDSAVPYADLNPIVAASLAQHLIVTGDEAADLAQVAAVSKLATAEHRTMAGAGHDVALVLRKRRELQPLIASVLAQ